MLGADIICAEDPATEREVTVVDVSAWQTGLVLEELIGEVTGVIAKLTQNFEEESTAQDWLGQIRGSQRWQQRGWYHFLGPGDVARQVDAFAFTLGDLHEHETIWLDWETNAFTHYAPPRGDAYRWLTIAEKRWPGTTPDGIPRVGWYSYRSNAIGARQSGDFPLPLWLSDPNVDGAFWADTLKATMRQWGQPAIAPIGGTMHNLDCSDVIDAGILSAMGGDVTPQEVQQFLDSPLGQLIGDDGKTMVGTDGTPTGPAFTVRQTLIYGHEEGKTVRLELGAAIARLNAAIAALEAHGAAGFGNGPFNLKLDLSGIASST